MSAPKKLSFADLDQETLALERQLEILSQQGFSVDHLTDDSDSNPPVDDNATSAVPAKASVAGTSSMPVIASNHQQQTGAHVSKSPWGSSGSQSNSSNAADSSRKNTKVEGHASASGNSKDSQLLENGNI